MVRPPKNVLKIRKRVEEISKGQLYRILKFTYGQQTSHIFCLLACAGKYVKNNIAVTLTDLESTIRNTRKTLVVVFIAKQCSDDNGGCSRFSIQGFFFSTFL